MARKMINILARHQGIYETAKVYHWLCKQKLQEFYGNHLLFDRIADMFNPADVDKVVEAFYMGVNSNQILELNTLWRKAANKYLGAPIERIEIEDMKKELLRMVTELKNELNVYKHKDRGINSMMDAFSENCLQSMGLLQPSVSSENA